MVDGNFHGLWETGDWHTPIASSLVGKSHGATGTPNQDSVRIKEWKTPHAICLAVSDGHGSESYWRSDQGSRIAVESLVAAIDEHMIPSLAGTCEDASRLKMTWEGFPSLVHKIWLKNVAQHLYDNPLIGDELSTAIEKHPSTIQRPIRLYGATLSGVLITRDAGFFFHLGDGDVLGCDGLGNGKTIFEEPEIKANDTDSLCLENASKKTRTRILEGDAWQKIQLLNLSTDGVGDAFSGQSKQFEHLQSYLSTWRKDGFESTAGMLEEHLPKFTEYSGDDVTMALVKRVEGEDELNREEFEKAWELFQKKADEKEQNALQKIASTEAQSLQRVEEAAKRVREDAKKFPSWMGRVENLLDKYKRSTWSSDFFLALTFFMSVVALVILSVQGCGDSSDVPSESQQNGVEIEEQEAPEQDDPDKSTSTDRGKVPSKEVKEKSDQEGAEEEKDKNEDSGKDGQQDSDTGSSGETGSSESGNLKSQSVGHKTSARSGRVLCRRLYFEPSKPGFRRKPDKRIGPVAGQFVSGSPVVEKK